LGHVRPGTILGLTRGTTRGHLVRAALEAIAYQTREVLQAAVADAGIALEELRVDGGATANDLLMQFQADVLGAPVVRPVVRETTALGAAYLAGWRWGTGGAGRRSRRTGWRSAGSTRPWRRPAGRVVRRVAPSGGPGGGLVDRSKPRRRLTARTDAHRLAKVGTGFC